MASADGWTADEMGDLRGQTAVVTGANSGLGYEVAKQFAVHGADVVLACRDVDRGTEAGERIRGLAPTTRLTVIEVDLADLSSIRAFAASFENTHDELHYLCNNAGVMAVPRGETSDGFETQFGVNHLGHFALTGLLLGRLRATDGETRVVTQSSGLHENGEIDFDSVARSATRSANSAERSSADHSSGQRPREDGNAVSEDLQHEDSYDEWDAYGQSKLANVLFAYELQRRLRKAGIEDVTSVASHPGYADTNLQRRGPEQFGSRLRLWGMTLANALLAQSQEMGALPMLYAATAPDIEGGEYVGPEDGRRGHPAKQASSDRSYDETTAARLWDVSEDLTGVGYEFAPLAEI